MIDIPPSDVAPIDRPPADWNPLPARARPLFLLGGALSMGVIGAVGGVVAGLVASSEIHTFGRLPLTVAIAATLTLLTSSFGLWIGYKSHRYTRWRLDEEGLAVHRGKLWQRETRVPATRVQHLDLRRGPLQRRRDLATLIVHTAGTAHSSVSIPNLDLGDAEILRDRLGRQIDRDDD
ncbi:PH domain-containing protein [Marilutibacter chinensis]